MLSMVMGKAERKFIKEKFPVGKVTKENFYIFVMNRYLSRPIH